MQILYICDACGIGYADQRNLKCHNVTVHETVNHTHVILVVRTIMIKEF